MCPDSFPHDPDAKLRPRRKKKPFTHEEDERIRRGFFGASSATRLSKELGRYRVTVIRRAHSLGLEMYQDPSNPPQGRLTVWQTWEDEIILSRYALDGPRKLSEHSDLHPARSRRAITKRAAMLGVCYSPKMAHPISAPWSQQESAILLAYLAGPDGAPLPEIDGRTSAAVATKLRSLRSGESRSKVLRVWARNEDAYLRTHYSLRGALHCAEHLGRSLAAVHNRANDLGIHYTVRS